MADLKELPGYTKITQTAHGVCLFNPNDQYVGGSFLHYKEFSEAEGAALESLLVDGDFVIEVGSNIGAHTVRIARKVGEHGRVIAFEPQRTVYQILCANLALNGLINVDAHWGAVSQLHESIAVPDLDPRIPNNFGALPLEEVQDIGGPPVPCFRLDDLLPSVPRLRLLKIDVEGMESDVIASGTQMIRALRPLLYVENDRPEKSKLLMQQIADLGYRMYWHIPFLFRPDNFAGNSENVFGVAASFNMLCAPVEMGQSIDLPEATDFAWHPMNADTKVAA